MWFLAPPERLHALTGGGAARVDVFGDGRRADEAHGLDVGMIEQRVDGGLVAVHDVEYAGREARLLEQLPDQHRVPRDRARTASG